MVRHGIPADGAEAEAEGIGRGGLVNLLKDGEGVKMAVKPVIQGDAEPAGGLGEDLAGLGGLDVGGVGRVHGDEGQGLGEDVELALVDQILSVGVPEKDVAINGEEVEGLAGLGRAEGGVDPVHRHVVTDGRRFTHGKSGGVARSGIGGLKGDCVAAEDGGDAVSEGHGRGWWGLTGKAKGVSGEGVLILRRAVPGGADPGGWGQADSGSLGRAGAEEGPAGELARVEGVAMLATFAGQGDEEAARLGDQAAVLFDKSGLGGAEDAVGMSVDVEIAEEFLGAEGLALEGHVLSALDELEAAEVAEFLG